MINVIQNLVEKAELPFKAEYNDHYLKFAEDVVKQCMQVCLEQQDPPYLNYKPSEKFADILRYKFKVWK